MKKLYRLGGSILFFLSAYNCATVDFAILLMLAAIYSILAALYEEQKNA